MLGLFGTLNLGMRSLQTQRTGVEVAGQNMANVNNPAYSRQRVNVETGLSLPTSVGPQGTGANVVSIQQIRSALLDSQMQSEISVGGYWEAQQGALQFAQAGLGEFLDRFADSLSASSATGDSGTVRGLADEISGLFNAFQSVATSPGSLTERQLLANQTQQLTDRFNQTATRLTDLQNSLDRSLDGDVTAANKLLSDIANLNDRINRAEATSNGVANDLRDSRQSRIEELAKLVNIQTGTAPEGGVEISIDGNVLVSDKQMLDSLETYDAGGGQMLVRTATAGVPLNITGGSMQGTIDVRDGALGTLRSNLDSLASVLIAEVNNIHGGGFGMGGSTGAAFFTGTDAATIGFNASLKSDPALIQAAGVSDASGDNTVALAIAQLATRPLSALGNQTFSEAYNQIVAGMGQALNNANNQMADHDMVEGMLLRQRDSISGVSIDEEMTDLMRFQKAYEASARLITTVDEMLDTVLNLKR